MLSSLDLLVNKITKFKDDPCSLGLILNALPLLRHSSQSPAFDAAFYSFDSFCAPHLESLTSVIKAVRNESSDIDISFYCSPACHYILSVPNCLDSIGYPDIDFKLFNRLDQDLLAAADMNGVDRLERVIIHRSIFDIETYKGADLLWSALEQAFIYIKASRDTGLFKHFPIDQFVLRDLSLTYKTATLCDIKDDEVLSKYFWLGCLVYTYLYCWEALYVPSHSFGAVFSDYAPCFTLRYSYQLANQTLYQIENRQPYFVEPDKSGYLIIAPHNFKGILARTPDLINSLDSCVLREDVIKRFFQELERRVTGGRGGHVYSPNKRDVTVGSCLLIQKWINQNPNGTIFAAFTSSEDESIADNISLEFQDLNSRELVEPIFKSHLEWILYLCELFATRLRSCLLIIRIHPRQGADHRGLPESPTYKNLLAKLRLYRQYTNIIIVPPDESVSSYYLGLRSDYILNAWSTIGFEFSMLAKPVIGAFYRTKNGSAYSFSDQPCFYRGFSLSEYENLILEASAKELLYNHTHGYNSLFYLFCISYAFVRLVEDGNILDSIVAPKPKTDVFLRSLEHSSVFSTRFSTFCKYQAEILCNLSDIY